MIELIAVTRLVFGESWTPEDALILRRSRGALVMASHDMRDAIVVRVEVAIGDYARRLVCASGAPG